MGEIPETLCVFFLSGVSISAKHMPDVVGGRAARGPCQQFSQVLFLSFP